MAPLPSSNAPSSSRPAPSSRSPSTQGTRLQRLIAKHGKRSSQERLQKLFQIPSKVRHSRQKEFLAAQKALPMSAKTQAMQGHGSDRDGNAFLVRKSPKNNKKWVAINLSTNRQVHFGHPEYEDYTQHGDDVRKHSYLKRHALREQWGDLTTPGAWARHLLWSKPDLEQAARAMQKRFNIDITLKSN